MLPKFISDIEFSKTLEGFNLEPEIFIELNESIQAEILKLRNAGVFVEVDQQVPLVAQNLNSEINTTKESLLLNQSDPLANFLYAVELLLNLFENTEAGSLKSVAKSIGLSESINDFMLSDLWNTN